MTHRRITAQQVFEAQELLSAANDLPSDHYPPTPQQVAEAERTILKYESQMGKCEVCGKPAIHLRRRAANVCHECLLLERRQIAASKRHEAKCLGEK